MRILLGMDARYGITSGSNFVIIIRLTKESGLNTSIDHFISWYLDLSNVHFLLIVNGTFIYLPRQVFNLRIYRFMYCEIQNGTEISSEHSARRGRIHARKYTKKKPVSHRCSWQCTLLPGLLHGTDVRDVHH